MSRKFQIGDLVVMNKKADRHYAYTKTGTKWYVVGTEYRGQEVILAQADTAEEYLAAMKSFFALYYRLPTDKRADGAYERSYQNHLRESREFQIWPGIDVNHCTLAQPYASKNIHFVSLLSKEGLFDGL